MRFPGLLPGVEFIGSVARSAGDVATVGIVADVGVAVCGGRVGNDQRAGRDHDPGAFVASDGGAEAPTNCEIFALARGDGSRPRTAYSENRCQ